MLQPPVKIVRKWAHEVLTWHTVEDIVEREVLVLNMYCKLVPDAEKSEKSGYGNDIKNREGGKGYCWQFVQLTHRIWHKNP